LRQSGINNVDACADTCKAKADCRSLDFNTKDNTCWFSPPLAAMSNVVHMIKKTSCLGRTYIFQNKLGHYIQVNADNFVTMGSDVNLAHRFIGAYPCLASTTAVDCISLMSFDKRDWFPRHYWYQIYLEPRANPRNPAIFHLDASFNVRRDLFFPGFDALESVNYPGHFLMPNTNNVGLRIAPLAHQTATTEMASFRLIELDL
jgi:hypothetical protein